MSRGSENHTDRIKELERELENFKANSKKQIEKSISKYKRLIDSTSEGYLELASDLKTTSCNETILLLLGKDQQDLINQPLDSLYDKDSVFVHFASSKHLNFEADFFTGTGSTIPLLCKRSIIRDDVSCLEAAVGIVGLLWLGRDHLGLRGQGRECQAGARDHAAAANWRHDHVETVSLLHELL